MSSTDNLRLPFIAEAQAMKHVTHNEALRTLDAVVHLSVLSRTGAVPPAEPAPGDRHIVAAGAADAWAGHEGAVAVWQDGAWAFYDPATGWVAYIAEDDGLAVFRDGGWTMLGAAGGGDQSADRLGINTVADDTNRLSVKADATLLTHDDVTPGNGDHRLVMNKAARDNTATVLFQSGFGGLAEFGAAGTDDIRLRVSPDGLFWRDAILVDRYTGEVRFPNTPDATGRFDADIYVDSRFGDDTRDGRTQATAYRSLDRAAAVARAVGDGVRIALAAGSVWRESLDLGDLNNVVVAGHGDLAGAGLPDIRGDDSIPGPWRTSGDRGDAHTTVFSADFSWAATGTGDTWLQVFEHADGTDDAGAASVQKLAFAATIADCAATPGTFCVEGLDASGAFPGDSTSTMVTLHIHPVGSTDPRSDGKAYHGSARREGIVVGHDSVLRHLAAYRAGADEGSLIGGRRCLLDRCLAFDGVRAAMTVQSGEFRDCVAFGRFADDRAAPVLMQASSALDISAEAGRWTRSIAVCAPAVRDASDAIGMGGGATGAFRYAGWIVEDCALVECSVSMDGVDRFDMRRTTLRNGHVTPRVAGTQGARLTDVQIVYDRVPVTAPAGVTTDLTGVPVFPVFIEGLRLSVPEGVTGILDANDLTLRRSVLDMRGTGGAGGPSFLMATATAPAPSSIDMETTVLIADEGYIRLGTDDTLLADRNVYSGSGIWDQDGAVGAGGDLAAWQTHSGQEAGSLSRPVTIADPLAGNWTLTGDLGATGAGLDRPAIAFEPTPSDVGAARAALTT